MKRTYFGERFFSPAVLDNEDFFVLVLWNDDTRIEVPLDFKRYDPIGVLRDRENPGRRERGE